MTYTSGWQPQPANWFLDEARLTRLRIVLGDGPTAEVFELPPGLTVETSPGALRFRGSGPSIEALEGEFNKLARSAPGAEVRVDGWILRVQNEPTEIGEEFVIAMPWFAWKMAGHLFKDVVNQYETNPFDFSRVGYIVKVDAQGQRQPWPRPDIGVIVEYPIWTDSDEQTESSSE